MAKKYAPSEIEHHLKYEIDMLNGSYALIDNIDALLDAGNADAIQRQVAVNALKEDFCLHARALIEFFTKPRGENSASGFAPGYSTPPEPGDYVRKLNNQISHLMDARTMNSVEKITDASPAAIMQWLERELRAFRAALAHPYDKIAFPDVHAVLTVPASDQASATNAILVVTSN